MVSAVMLMCVAFISCKEETFSAWNEGDTVLSAYKEKVASRAVAEYYFSEGTKYRIWVTNTGTQNPAFEGQEGGVEGTETIRQDDLHYINLGDYNNKLVGDYDFYGFTDSTETAPLASADGTYNISLNTGTNDYVDYRRGELKFADRGTSSVLRMPFKHIMSQVRVMVMCQEDINSTLTLKTVQFIGQKNGDLSKGVTFSANYNIFNNEFTNHKLAPRTILSNGEVEVPVVGTKSDANKEAKDLGTYLLFPEEQTDEVYYIRVKFVDTNNFYGIKDADGISTIDIPIYDNRVEGEKALHFEQNTSYTLYITFLSNTARIVTLVPKVFEWLDGEEDNLGNKYEEQDLGQPVTFNGVMWSDRNVGATSAHPTRSMDDWYKSVGYFYQYGRNIPYFPNNLKSDGTVDYKTDLAEALAMDDYFVNNGVKDKSGGLIYPVINYESWGTTAYAEREKIEPESNNNYYVIRKLGDMGGNNRYWGFIYDNYNLSHINNQGWDKGYNTPCPPGWRLPTTDDFKGIIPGSAYSGNITFRRYTEVGSNGSWYSHNAAEEPVFEIRFSKDTLSTSYVGVEGGPAEDVGKQVYKGFFPCVYREENNDPSPGARSQYILSMKGDDWNRVKQTSGDIRPNKDFIYNWGVIYGIKNVGTSSAYRVKWEVKLQSVKSPQEVDGVQVYGEPFRGVLVISRYQTSKDDYFTADENGSYEAALDKYDWENPVEQLSLPIGGYVDSWSKGHLGNIGMEAWYAISNRDGINENYLKNIFWFKYCGTNASSQTAIISDKSLMVGAVQVRCVRDLGNK